ncbi:hypothetical protein ES708_00710 [subsurface metagenome]
MNFVIMRSDLSSVLNGDEGWFRFSSFRVASKSAENYCGVVVPEVAAKRIIKLQQKNKKLIREKEVLPL